MTNKWAGTKNNPKKKSFFNDCKARLIFSYYYFYDTQSLEIANNLNSKLHLFPRYIEFPASLRAGTGKTLAVVEVLLKENNEKKKDR